MKIRLISVLLAVILLLAGISWCQVQTTLGNINGDGKINAALQYSVGKIKRKEEEKQAANTTGDHAPNAKDALCILQKAVGSILYFSVEKKPVAWN